MTTVIQDPQFGQFSYFLQASSTTLWKNDPSVHGGSSDHTRSFLGTEQWGRESGGAPWGSTSHTESSSSATELPGSSLPPRTTDPSMFSHVTNSSWLASRKSPVFLVQQEVGNVYFVIGNCSTCLQHLSFTRLIIKQKLPKPT